MKKLLSILLTLSLLLSLTTFSGAAIPERTSHIAHDASDAWHPFCDEYHSACGLGWYPTCTIYLY